MHRIFSPRTIFAALLLPFLAACQQPAPVDNSPGLSDALDLSHVDAKPTDNGLPEDWHKHAVFMEIYVRGYQDSDGDGIGDFNGLTSRLDYIQSLGVKGIWLMPMMQSQDRDHGYAVTDYRKVEPDYGTKEDFQRFLKEAHARGIGVIIDYLINHSAAQNPLFLDSDANRAGKRDWYVWRNEHQSWKNWGGSDTWHPGKNGYYYGIFWDQMPDFNLRNPDVVNFHQNNLRYWLNLGVDGFRFDAVGTLFENGASGMLNQSDNHTFLANSIRPIVHEYPNRYMVCENPDGPSQTAKSCGSAFYFGLQGSILASAKFGKTKQRLIDRVDGVPMENYATLLANHDSFAGGRIIQQLKGDEDSYRMAAATLLTLPGTPFIYYGEEIGIGHSRDIKDPDPDHRLRTPMSWTADPVNAGFSSVEPFRALANNVETHNVADQLERDDSLLANYRHWITLRNNQAALQTGKFATVDTDTAHLFAFTRSLPQQERLVVLNYASTAKALGSAAEGCWQVIDHWPGQTVAGKLTASTELPGQTVVVAEPCD
ncbi:alpha-amylase family glycosyl hydrolase [Corallincola platygyrae]|uniref:Alpha-amylase family glycosyl hydrolase n=1 Tax=Corallincola platygyrae TaxID=1193278 RepID=A0ABW4XM90_9GAMM